MTVKLSPTKASTPITNYPSSHRLTKRNRLQQQVVSSFNTIIIRQIMMKAEEEVIPFSASMTKEDELITPTDLTLTKQAIHDLNEKVICINDVV